MKVDKELLLKNRFWVLLGVGLLLAIGVVFLLMTSVRAAIAKQRDTIVKKRDAVNKRGVSVGPNVIAKKREIAQQYEAQQTKAWEQAEKPQRPELFWPDAVQQEFDLKEG